MHACLSINNTHSYSYCFLFNSFIKGSYNKYNLQSIIDEKCIMSFHCVELYLELPLIAFYRTLLIRRFLSKYN